MIIPSNWPNGLPDENKDSLVNAQSALTLLKRQVRDQIKKVVSISSLRHEAIGADVDYLASLEEKYWENEDPDNLEKAQAIKIKEDYIELAGLEICRFDYTLIDRKLKGVFTAKNGTTTLFTPEAAHIHIVSLNMNKKIFSIPWRTDWGNIFKSIPGATRVEKITNFITILNLNNAGYRSIKGDLHDGTGMYLSSCDADDTQYVLDVGNMELSHFGSYYSSNAFSLRLIKR